MADNIQVKNATGVIETVRTTDTGGVHTPHQRSSVPTSASASIISVTTAATGTNWTAFASTACVALDIVNNSGTTIEYRRGGTGSSIPIPSGSARLVVGITNANTIDVRRVDTANTQVTITAEAIVV
jgi:hypothetical protein